MFVFVGYL